MAKRKQKPAVEREFCFQGRATLSGVTFFVKAASEDEAREKAEAGDYFDVDERNASWVDWKIDPSTCEPN